MGLPDSSLPVPLYRQVFMMLRQRIVDHVYAPGDQLLREDGLADEFGVSRATIRQAIGELVRQGLVDRKQGRGTFVLPMPQPPLGQRFRGSLADLVAENDRRSVRDVEITHQSPVKARVAEALMLDDKLATIVRRIRTVDGAIFAYTVNHLPDRFGRMMDAAELRQVGLMTLLESKGVRFASAQQSIRAELADVEVSARLEMDFGGAVLFAERVLFDEDGSPVDFVQSWYRGDLYEYSVALAVGQDEPDIRAHLA